MVKVNIDFDDIISFSYIPPGVKPFEIHNAEMRKASTGSDMLVVTFKCLDSENKNSALRENFVIKAESLWVLKIMLDAAKVKYSSKGFETEDLVGKRLNISVIDTEFEGQARSKADSYLPYKGLTDSKPEISGLEDDKKEEPSKESGLNDSEELSWEL